MKKLIHTFGRWYIRRICQSEYKSQAFRRINERPIEFRYLFDVVTRLCPQTVLDVGTGKTAVPKMLRTCGCVVTAIDNVHDYWSRGMVNRHWHVIHDDITNTKLPKQFDLVTCISVLEHIVDHHKAVRNMFGLLNEGGHLIVTCPYSEEKYIENVYLLSESNAFGKSIPFVCQSYSREELNTWLSENDGEIVDQEYWQCLTGEFWTTGDQTIPPLQVDSTGRHQLTCILIRKGEPNQEAGVLQK